MLTLSIALVAVLAQEDVPIISVPSRQTATSQSTVLHTDPPPGVVPLPPLPPNRAGLTFFLPAKASNDCVIRYRGRTLVTVKPGNYVQWAVRPGRYAFAVQSARLIMSAERGKTRFIRCDSAAVDHHRRAALTVVSQQQYGDVSTDLTGQPPIKLETDPRYMKK